MTKPVGCVCTPLGKLLVNGGAIELHVVQCQKRPGLTRMEATLQGLTIVQAYDGTSRTPYRSRYGKG